MLAYVSKNWQKNQVANWFQLLLPGQGCLALICTIYLNLDGGKSQKGIPEEEKKEILIFLQFIVKRTFSM